jgi:soluble lytic murein transglycosylase-like protein
MKYRWLILCFSLFMMSGAAAVDLPVDSDQWTRKYDRLFRKYTKHYFGPHFEWRWFKSQSIAESRLNPKATSHVGARGIMQIMPATYEEIKKKNPHFYAITSPKWNIAAGIFYDRQLYRKWNKGFSQKERLALMFAAYNAGYAGVRKAYKKALKRTKKIKTWNQIEPFAPRETSGYVKKIRGYMQAK